MWHPRWLTDPEAGRRDRYRLARLALWLYLVGLIFSQMLLAAAGGRVGVYAVLGGIALVIMLADELRLRLVGMAAVLCMLVLMVDDHTRGTELERIVATVRARSEARVESGVGAATQANSPIVEEPAIASRPTR